ncbi:hypothetical protein [Chitinibacter sp. ZOR0017]|uniref:hypothetical protein n=1 Tax=Chitinibacter sp. ZOR0017 TaxID=1339254 RepID=UPI000646E390|nr:hypothetical protein [Chitinibacter sp. ZOR0017]
MGINSAKQDAKRLKRDHQEAGHHEDELINEARRTALNEWLSQRKQDGRAAAAQRHLDKQALQQLQRKKK